jgi:hypothetical protein
MTSLLRALFQLGTSDDERWKESLRDSGAGAALARVRVTGNDRPCG